MPISFEEALQRLQHNEGLTRGGAIQRLIDAREHGDPEIKNITGLNEGIDYEENSLPALAERYTRSFAVGATLPFVYPAKLAGYPGPYEAVSKFPEERLPNTVADVSGLMAGSTIPYLIGEGLIGAGLSALGTEVPATMLAASRAGRAVDVAASALSGAAIAPAYNPEHPFREAAIGGGMGLGVGLVGPAFGNLMRKLFNRPITQLSDHPGVANAIKYLARRYGTSDEEMWRRFNDLTLGELQAASAKNGGPAVDVASTLKPEDIAEMEGVGVFPQRPGQPLEFTGPQGSWMRPQHGPPEFVGPEAPMTPEAYRAKLGEYWRGRGEPLPPNAGPPPPRTAREVFGRPIETPDVAAPANLADQMNRNPNLARAYAEAQHVAEQPKPGLTAEDYFGKPFETPADLGIEAGTRPAVVKGKAEFNRFKVGDNIEYSNPFSEKRMAGRITRFGIDPQSGEELAHIVHSDGTPGVVFGDNLPIRAKGVAVKAEPVVPEAKAERSKKELDKGLAAFRAGMKPKTMSELYAIGDKINYPLAGGRGRADGVITAFEKNPITGIENAIVESTNGVTHTVSPLDEIRASKPKGLVATQKTASLSDEATRQLKQNVERLNEQAAATTQVLPEGLKEDSVLKQKIQETLDLIEANKQKLNTTRKAVKTEFDNMVTSKPGAKKLKLKKC